MLKWSRGRIQNTRVAYYDNAEGEKQNYLEERERERGGGCRSIKRAGEYKR